MDKLLSAAKASACESSNSNSSVVIMKNINIDKNSTREEILDFIMIFLCERIDLSLSVFKGGYVLTKMIPDEARLTEDIDFSISEESQYEDLKVVLNDLGEVLKNKDIIEDYDVKPTIAPTSSGGIKMTPIDGTSQIKIDVGWHDISWGIQDWKCLGFDCKKFEVERMLSDKISAIYSKKRFRRTKDIYDFYILTNNFDVDISKLRNYIERRGTIEWDRDPFREEVLTEYGKAYDKLKVMTHNGLLVNKPDFNKVILRLRDFMNMYKKDVIWNHIEREFREV